MIPRLASYLGHYAGDRVKSPAVVHVSCGEDGAFCRICQESSSASIGRKLEREPECDEVVVGDRDAVVGEPLDQWLP